MTSDGNPSTSLLLRELTAGDVAFAAELHHRCLPGGFFARLGVRFLRTYYQSFVESPWAVALLAEVDGYPAGMVVGTLDDARHYRFVLRRCGARLALSGLLALLTRPGLAWWFLRRRARRYARGFMRIGRPTPPAGARRPAGAASPDPTGALAHLAVAPGRRRAGVGSALASAFLDQARSAGAARVGLLTSADDPATAAFYASTGWAQAGRRVDVDGRSWVRFTRVP